jgi:hypothetical protein
MDIQTRSGIDRDTQIKLLAKAIDDYLDWREWRAKVKAERKAKAMANRMWKKKMEPYLDEGIPEGYRINDLQNLPRYDKLRITRGEYVQKSVQEGKSKSVPTTDTTTEWWSSIRDTIAKRHG